MPAYVSEVRRQGDEIRAAYSEGALRSVELMRGALPKGKSPKAARRRALALISGMVGSVAIARALGKTDPRVSKEIIEAARKEFGYLATR